MTASSHQVNAVCGPQCCNILDLNKNPLQVHQNDNSQDCLKHTLALVTIETHT